MRYCKKKVFGSFLFVFALFISGCKDSGDNFIGRWVEVLKVNASYSVPSELVIEKDGDIFHIDMISYRNVMKTTINKNGSFVEKYEAIVESDSVLSIIDNRETPLRLTDGIIDFSDRKFKKIN